MKSDIRELTASSGLVPSPFQYYLFLAWALLSLVVLICLIIAVRLRMRKASTAENLKALLWYLRLSIGYIAVNSLEVLAPTAGSTLFFMKACYPFITAIPLGLFFFSLSLTGRDPPTRSVPFLRCAFPAFATLIVFTNEWHRLNWGELAAFKTGPFLAVRALSYGPWFWFVWISMQIAVAVGSALVLVGVFSRARTLNRHSLTIIVGALVPIAVNALYVLRIFPLWQKDFSAIAFGFSGILFSYGILGDRLFDLVPIARRVLVDVLADPLVVVDGSGRIVDINPAAVRVCGLGEVPLGLRATDSPFLSAVVASLAGCGPRGGGDGTATEASPDGERWYEVRAAKFPANADRSLRLYAMRDVTESRRLMGEKVALAERLSGALAEIRTLQGIVPICSACKKIRDDSGYWQQVESYVASRTKIEFNPGLCPNCRGRIKPNRMGSDQIDAEEEYGRSSQ